MARTKLRLQAESVRNDFEKALKRLEEALELSPTRIHKDASIQRFEFCFELVWKLFQITARYFGLECASPRNCIRIAHQLKLIGNPELWLEFLEARNWSSHIYNEKLANLVYKYAEKFAKESRKMLQGWEKLIACIP